MVFRTMHRFRFQTHTVKNVIQNVILSYKLKLMDIKFNVSVTRKYVHEI
jgi:hypothetical protein